MLTIQKKITVKAPNSSVFDALTTSSEIPKYFPLHEVISTWKKGAEVLYKGEVNGAPFTDFGIIEVLDKPNLYAYRYWSDNHGTERTEENHIKIRYDLKETPEGTELTLMQSNIPSEELFTLMKDQVWDYLLGSLKAHVESQSPNHQD